MNVIPSRIVKIKVVDGSYSAGATNVEITKFIANIPWIGDIWIGHEVSRTGGSSTFDLKTQTSIVDGTASWRDADTFTQVSGASGGEIKALTKVSNVMRLVITVGSTTTFSVKIWMIGAVQGALPKLT